MNQSRKLNKSQSDNLFLQYNTTKKGLNDDQFKRLLYDYYKLQQNPTLDRIFHDLLHIADGTGFFNRHDNLLNKNEFLQIMSKLPMKLSSDELSIQKDFCRVIFEIIDKDHSEYLDKKELQNLFKKIGTKVSKETAKALFSEYDLNGDGQVSFDEFIQVYLKDKK